MKEKIGAIVRQKYFKELIKYGLVGLVGLVIDMGVYYLLVDKFSVQFSLSVFIQRCLSLVDLELPLRTINILISSIISSTLAIINNFVLNSYFTFKVTDNKLKRFTSFFGVAAIGMVVSTLLLTLFIDILYMNEMLAKAIAVLIVAMLQFVINKFFTFKEKPIEG